MWFAAAAAGVVVVLVAVGTGGCGEEKNLVGLTVLRIDMPCYTLRSARLPK